MNKSAQKDPNMLMSNLKLSYKTLPIHADCHSAQVVKDVKTDVVMCYIDDYRGMLTVNLSHKYNMDPQAMLTLKQFATQLVKNWCVLDKKFINRTAMIGEIHDLLQCFDEDLTRKIARSDIHTNIFDPLESKIQSILFANLAGCDAVYDVMSMGNRDFKIRRILRNYFEKKLGFVCYNESPDCSDNDLIELDD